MLRAEHPDQAIVFTRTKIRCDQLYRRLRDRGMNVKALHGDMSQGQRDGVMLAFKAGRLPILVATDVAARGLDISTVTHVVNFDVPTSPDAYVHRIGRTGRVGRAGRAITFIEPRQQRELAAIERHIGTEITPWAEGARTTPAPVAERPRRHSKPHLSRDGDEPQAKLVAGVGRAEGVEVADLVHAVTSAAGIDGEAVRDVRVLEHFSFLSVPLSDAERVVDSVNGTPVNGAHAAPRDRARLSAHGCPQPRLRFARCPRCVQPWTCEAARGRACPCARSGSGGPHPRARRSSRRAPRGDRGLPCLRRFDGAGQDWCLNCGTAAPGALGDRPAGARPRRSSCWRSCSSSAPWAPATPR